MYGENFGMCLRCIMKIFLKVYVRILGMVLKVYGEFRYGAKGVWRKFS